MANVNSKWIGHNPKEFVSGDIICNSDKQDFLRLVLYVDNIALWVTGFVHCAFTENLENHPIFPMYFDDMENWPKLTKLGNLTDYLNFIPNVQEEIKCNIKNINGYYNSRKDI